MELVSSIDHKKLVWILGFAGLISAADNWIVSPILPAIAASFMVPISQVGVVLTTYMIPYGFMQPVYGFYSDRCSKVHLLQWIVGGLALGTIGCAFANSLVMLFFWRAFSGFFAAGIIAVSLACIGDTVPPQDRQKYVGKFMGIVFLGQGLSVGLGGIFAKYFTWRAAFFIFAIAAVCALVLLRKLPIKAPENPEIGNFMTELKRVIVSPTGIIIFPLAFITGFLLLGLYSYLGAYLHEVAGLDYLQVGIVVMFYGFACLLAGSQVGKIGNTIGYNRTMMCGGCLALSSALLLATFSSWQSGWLATVNLGFGYIFIQSTLATLAFEVASENKGLPSALVGLGLFGGGGLGTAFGGWILSQWGYQTLWLIFAVSIMAFIYYIAKQQLR